MTEPSAANKILLVDDEDFVRRVCETVLRSHGFDLIVATNGAEALGIFNERHHEICLVLSDVSMPKMNGLDLFRRILVTDPRANVILMSGYSTDFIVPEDLQRLCSLLDKPFTAEKLIGAVRKCLKYEEEHHPFAATRAGEDSATPYAVRVVRPSESGAGAVVPPDFREERLTRDAAGDCNPERGEERMSGPNEIGHSELPEGHGHHCGNQKGDKHDSHCGLSADEVREADAQSSYFGGGSAIGGYAADSRCDSRNRL